MHDERVVTGGAAGSVHQPVAQAAGNNQGGAAAAVGQVANHLHAVHFGHHQIQQYVARPPTVEGLEEVLGSGRDPALIAQVFGHVAHGLADIRVVIQDQ